MPLRKPARPTRASPRYRHRILGSYIGELIDARCAKLEITQAAVAKSLDLSPVALSQYRNGVYHPDEDARRTIARGLGGKISEMIAREMADKMLYVAESVGSRRYLRRALELVREALR